MPAYKKKITNLMDYETFKEAIADLPRARQAFLSVLFFSGCRVSEALALTPEDIHCAYPHELQYSTGIIFVNFFRLKGSKQTDPIPLPRTDAIDYLCGLEDDPFPWSRTTGYRIVKQVFPKLYPHYFRMNRIVKISDEFGDATVYSFVGICAQSIDHYRGKVDIKKVGKALLDEIQQ